MDDRLKKLIDTIRKFTFSLKGTIGNEVYTIPLEDILYIESVDGKTFLYCSNKVYESRETLTSLEQMLLHTSFLRISKNCIMNLNELKCVKALFNHRMEASMKNGERLIVSRNYIDDLKNKLEE
jgi:DNA-binding LytR/AlgR family response regulator